MSLNFTNIISALALSTALTAAPITNCGAMEMTEDELDMVQARLTLKQYKESPDDQKLSPEEREAVQEALSLVRNGPRKLIDENGNALLEPRTAVRLEKVASRIKTLMLSNKWTEKRADQLSQILNSSNFSNVSEFGYFVSSAGHPVSSATCLLERGEGIGEKVVIKLALGLRTFKTLTILRLENKSDDCFLTEAAGEAIGKTLSNLPFLEHFKFEWNISSLGTRKIIEELDHPVLKYLFLYCKFEDEEYIALANKFEKLPGLEQFCTDGFSTSGYIGGLAVLKKETKEYFFEKCKSVFLKNRQADNLSDSSDG